MQTLHGEVSDSATNLVSWNVHIEAACFNVFGDSLIAVPPRGSRGIFSRRAFRCPNPAGRAEVSQPLRFRSGTLSGGIACQDKGASRRSHIDAAAARSF